jgi:thymidylate synthase (FAD)
VKRKMSVNLAQKNEIQELQEATFQTRRATVPALEEVLYEAIPVLDHGFIRVIDYMGDDAAIVQAARVSYGKGTKKISEDKGLINYLLRHRHTTPFEMCEIKFHIKLPIFIARQWIRHRTANVNEYSARYSILDREFYIPHPEHLAAQSQTNKQGRSTILEGEEAKKALDILTSDAERAYDHYIYLLNENDEGHPQDPNRLGLARELARMNLPLNTYTQWYWKVDLHNLLHFLNLRADPHAQYEIRIYAQKMLELVEKWVPITYNAFMDYYVGSTSLSAKGMQIVKDMLAGKEVSRESYGMGKREWDELMEKLKS